MKLTLAIDTPPQGRPRFTRTGIAYDPPKSRKFKAQLAQLILSQDLPPQPLSGNIRVRVEIYRNFNSPTVPRFGDIDNLAKIILDAINDTGAVWLDDRLITKLEVLKATAPEPHVDIWIDSLSKEAYQHVD